MSCSECGAGLVHIIASGVWMCELCPYAITDELYEQRLDRPEQGDRPGDVNTITSGLEYDQIIQHQERPWETNRELEGLANLIYPIQSVRNGDHVRFHPEG